MIRLFYHLLFLLGCFFCVTLLPAQQLNFINLGNSLNLPSEECYNILQDQRGYIWISTENGLCRYNGRTVKLYDKQNGLPEAAVYFIEERKNGTLRLISSTNRILKIEQDTLTEEPYSQTYQTFLKDSLRPFQVSYLLEEDAQSNIVVNSLVRTYRINTNTNTARVNDLTVENPYKTKAHIVVVNTARELLLLKDHRVTHKGTDKKAYEMIIDFRTEHQQKNIVVPFDKNTFPDDRVKVCKVGDVTFIGLHNKLIRVDADLNYTIHEMPGPILSLYADKDKGLWLGLYQKGLYYYTTVSTMTSPIVSLQGYSVTGTLLDQEGGVWCTTLENGVYYCASPYVLDYSGIPGLSKVSTLLKGIGQQLFVSTENDRYILLTKDSLLRKNLGFRREDAITDVLAFGGDWYVASKGYLIRTDAHLRRKKLITERHYGISMPAFQLDTFQRELYGISASYVYKLEGDSARKVIKNFVGGRPHCLLGYRHHGLLVGCSDGLYLLNPQNNQLSKISNVQGYVTRLLRRLNGEVWVATKAGLFRLQDTTAIALTLGKDYDSDVLLDMAEDRYGSLWMATNKGLLKITQSGNRLHTQNYTVANGLIADNIRQLAVVGDRLYVSTRHGLSSLPVNRDLFNALPPPVFLNALQVNAQHLMKATAEQVFQASDNSLTLTFDALTFRKQAQGILAYRLLGSSDDSLRISQQHDLQFDNLPPGNYELLVYALNNDGVKSNRPWNWKFTIEKPFWQKGWFIVACAAGFIGVLILLLKQIIRGIQRREAKKTEINKRIAESQLTALQAQMNPHFIFNAINSIQNYILKNDAKSAYTYLSKFSKLIRMVLNHSKESSLPLQQEIEMLDLYIELEKLRFKEGFDYQLTVAPTLNPYVLEIPAMLVQPYVENAIWHGLMNLQQERKGVLQIRISQEDQFLKIVVEDNGVGRTRAKAYKQGTLHVSVGMALAEQRLEIINKIKEEGVRVMVTDLQDANAVALGTRVELFLPLTI